MLVTVPRYPEYNYGDLVSITGELQTPPRLDDFDYKGYLAHQGIYATMYYPRIEVLEGGHGFPPLAWIYDLRGSLANTLAEVLPEPQASLAQGILLGLRGNIPADLSSDFTRSGTAHLLAISGVNLAIMAGILVGLGLWLFGRRHYLYIWLAFVIIWFYTIITGMNPPVVRGAIMASMFLFAEALGRQRSGMAALTFTAAVMVGISPYILGDASFQLSFLAMAGLIFIYPVLRDAGRRLIIARLGDEGFCDIDTECCHRQHERDAGGDNRRLAVNRLLLRHFFTGGPDRHFPAHAGIACNHYSRVVSDAARAGFNGGGAVFRLAGLALFILHDTGRQRFRVALDFFHQDRLDKSYFHRLLLRCTGNAHLAA